MASAQAASAGNEDAVTVHTPTDDDSPWIVVAALLAGAVVLVAAGWFVFSGNPESTLNTDPNVTTTVDTTVAFTNGWINGIVYAVYQVTGDQGMAVAYATGQMGDLPEDQQPPPADLTLTVPTDNAETAWCRGLVEGYVAVSIGLLDMGPPPDGWKAESIIGCLDGRMFDTPVIPDTGLTGGGGPPPMDG